MSNLIVNQPLLYKHASILLLTFVIKPNLEFMSRAGPPNRQNTVKFSGFSGPERSKTRSEKGYITLWARRRTINFEKSVVVRFDIHLTMPCQIHAFFGVECGERMIINDKEEGCGLFQGDIKAFIKRK